ncbi:hypothetical protein P7C70_g3687, partial [Phenoliferia sp. Uapishka_3]
MVQTEQESASNYPQAATQTAYHLNPAFADQDDQHYNSSSQPSYIPTSTSTSTKLPPPPLVAPPSYATAPHPSTTSNSNISAPTLTPWSRGPRPLSSQLQPQPSTAASPSIYAPSPSLIHSNPFARPDPPASEAEYQWGDDAASTIVPDDSVSQLDRRFTGKRALNGPRELFAMPVPVPDLVKRREDGGGNSGGEGWVAQREEHHEDGGTVVGPSGRPFSQTRSQSHPEEEETELFSPPPVAPLAQQYYPEDDDREEPISHYNRASQQSSADLPLVQSAAPMAGSYGNRASGEESYGRGEPYTGYAAVGRDEEEYGGYGKEEGLYADGGTYPPQVAYNKFGEEDQPSRSRGLGLEGRPPSTWRRLLWDTTPTEIRIEEHKRGLGVQTRPWAVWVLSATMVAVMIYELVHMAKLTGSPIQTKPSINIMIGLVPGVDNFAHIGVRALTEPRDARVILKAVDKYFSEDAVIVHPMLNSPANSGKEGVKAAYKMLRVLTLNNKITFHGVGFDRIVMRKGEEHQTGFIGRRLTSGQKIGLLRANLDLSEAIQLRFLPLPLAWSPVLNIRFIIRLDLRKSSVDNLWYIQKQEDNLPSDFGSTGLRLLPGLREASNAFKNTNAAARVTILTKMEHELSTSLPLDVILGLSSSPREGERTFLPTTQLMTSSSSASPTLSDSSELSNTTAVDNMTHPARLGNQSPILHLLSSVLMAPYNLVQYLVIAGYLLYQRMIMIIFSPTYTPPPPGTKPFGKIAIIGAGLTGISSGKSLFLAPTADTEMLSLRRTAAHCVAHGFEVTIFEAESDVGGVWARVNSTSSLQLNSISLFYSPLVLRRTLMRDFRGPHILYRFHPSIIWSRGYPRRDEIVQQITALWKRYHLESSTRLNTKVESVTREPKTSTNPTDGGHARWIINGEPEVYDAVLVTIGTCGKPKMGIFRGQESFRGTVLHSSQLDGADLKGKKVVIIGSGASGVEAAELCVSKGTKEAVVLARDDKWIIPRNTIFDIMLALQPFGREMPLSFIPEWIIRTFHYRDQKDKSPPHKGLFEGTPIVNDEFLVHLRQGLVTYKRGDTLEITSQGVKFSGRPRESKPGDKGVESIETADIIVMATGFERPSVDMLPKDLFPHESDGRSYSRPNLYLQNFSTEDWSILLTNASYMDAIGTVGNWAIRARLNGILARRVGSPFAEGHEDLTNWIKTKAFGDGDKSGLAFCKTFLYLLRWTLTDWCFLRSHVHRAGDLDCILPLVQHSSPALAPLRFVRVGSEGWI